MSEQEEPTGEPEDEPAGEPEDEPEGSDEGPEASEESSEDAPAAQAQESEQPADSQGDPAEASAAEGASKKAKKSERASKKARSAEETTPPAPGAVALGRRVLLAYRLRDAGSGALLAQSDAADPLSIVFETDRLLPGFEAALRGKQGGEELRLTLDPAEAFGEPQEGTARRFHRGDFPTGLELGPRFPFEAEGPDGSPLRYWVTEVKGDWIHADRNHPWAGRPIDLYAQILEVGAAKP